MHSKKAQVGSNIFCRKMDRSDPKYRHTVKSGKMQLLRVKCTVKKHELEAIFFL